MKRRSKDGGGKSLEPNAWMYSLCDLLTLMLTFFVLLISMSSLDAKKLEEAFGFFEGAFGVLEKGTDGTVNLADMPGSSKLVTQTAAEQDPLMVKRLDFLDDLRRRLDQLGMKEAFPRTSVEMSLNPRGIAVSFSDDILFDEGEAELSPRARSVLGATGEVIRKTRYHVVVEGHAGPEAIQPEGYKSAWDLSLARAATVLSFLVKDVMFPPHRLAIAAYGDMKPLFPNDTPEHRRRNQRVELVLYEQEGEAVSR